MNFDPRDVAHSQHLIREARALLDRIVRLPPGSATATFATELSQLNLRIDLEPSLADEPWTYTTSVIGRDAMVAAGREQLSTTWATFNPLAPAVSLTVGETDATGTVILSPAFYGPPGRAHGGTVATLLDHTMGSMLNLLDRASFTVRLTVDYLEAAALNKPLTLQASIERIEGRRTFTSGALLDGDRLLAHATGLFLTSDR